MDQIFRTIADDLALGCELVAALLLGFGAVELLLGLALGAPRWADLRFKKTLWVKFASWILLALELTLAADIVRTAISPTWNDIGQLAAIAAIRTFLNLFLERDLDALSRPPNLPAAPEPTLGAA
jgi:uncharacterized membrane protein